MVETRPSPEGRRLLSLSAELTRAETLEAVITHTAALSEAVFAQPAVSLLGYDPEADTVTTLGSPSTASTQADGAPDQLPGSILDRLGERGDAPSDDTPAVTVDTDPQGSHEAAALVPVGRNRVLRVGVTDPDELDETGVATVEGLAANVETALARVDRQQSVRAADPARGDAAALRRLNELTVGAGGFDRTIDRLLSLGCDHFGLETGILARVDGDDYEVEAVVDATGTHEPGAVYDLGETMCQATLAGEATGSLAFADVAETEHESHPAAEGVRAYIAAPVTVDGATYGTVNFSMRRPRPEPFRPEEAEFVRLVAQWVGTEVRRRRRVERLERYETVLEAVGDPVYALDAEGRFSFVNEAAKREFGYGPEVIGERPSVAMDDSDVERVRAQVEDLVATDERSTTAEFELETVDGDRKTVENRLALIGDDEFRGTAGVLRDITERNEQRRQLESFRQAVESARDGVAVLEDGEYTYVDQSHVEMYGFESTEQLLGDSWRALYGDAEVERLEQEAFPALEEQGYWRGMVTGSRPDGSTFPAEISLTRTEDGRLVCAVRDETERRARERELELRERAMDEAAVSIQITDPSQPDTPLVYVNDGFERLTGYTREEALGRNPRFLQGEDTDPATVTQLREAVAAEEPVSLELRNERKDGTPYWARLSFTPVTDEDGAVQRHIRIEQDITERKTREQQTEATVEVLERVYEVTTDPALSFEEKVDGLLTAGNEYLDLPSAFLTQIESGDSHAAGTQTVVQAQGAHDRLQPGESCPLPQSYCRKTIEDSALTAITAAAAEGWAGDPAYETFGLETYIAGAVDAGGDTYGTLCFAAREPRTTEFTETERSFVNLLRRWVSYELDRRTTREELRQERERLELTLSGTDTGLAEWDIRTDAVEWNDTLTELLGLDVDSRAAFEAAVHPDDREQVRAELRTAVETGEPWVSEFRVTDGDGAVRWVGVRGVPTYDDEGEPVRLLATATDITDRKRAEREREENERRYRSLAENIPNGGVLTFDAALEYRLAAGELLSEFGLEASDFSGQAVGTVFPDADMREELVSRFRAALEGERTDRRVELRGRTLRVHIVPMGDGDGEPAETRGLLLAQDVTEEARRERELSEERERFRLLTESVEEYAFLVVDEDGAIRTWNEGAETVFGYDAETALGMPMAELHPEADRGSGLPDRLLQQARVAGESGHEGYRVRADGSEFYADVRHAPLEADDGTFRGYAMIVRDMTDRRRQQRRTERFVEESDDVVTIVDADGTVTYASGSASRVLGHDPADLVGENLFDYIHPDGREDAMETFFTSAREPGASAQATCRVKSGTGEWLNIEGQCRNMLEDDAIDGMLLYLRDVTEQKERARRFEGIFNQTFQFTGLLEPDGTVLEANDAALEFGGIERDALVGEPFFDASWWTHSEDVHTEAREAIERAASGEFVRYETEVRGGTGLATIDFSVKPVTDEDGEVSLLIAEGRDITARQQHRQHLEVMQRVMRHNMRNDLTKVRGWAQVMCEETDPDKRAEQFETLEGTLDKWESMTERMSELRQILEVQQEQQSRTEAGSLVDDAVAPLRAEYTDATILTDISGGESVTVPATLLDAVRELVTNAAEATGDATIEVDLSSPEGGWVEVWVSDDGPGMPEMEADVLETGEETPLNHGQGLGLWMVRMVVTQVGGEVSVESSADGTDVCLRLPTRRTPEAGTPTTVG